MKIRDVQQGQRVRLADPGFSGRLYVVSENTLFLGTPATTGFRVMRRADESNRSEIEIALGAECELA